MRSLFEDTVSAICYSLAGDLFSRRRPGARANQVVRFVLAQHAAAPFFLRAPLRAATLAFSWHCLARTGRFFHQHGRERRAVHLESWRSSRLKPQRDLVRFYESLAVLPWYAAGSSVAPC